MMDQQRAAETMLMESISRGKLVGLQAFLMINTVLSSLLATSPLLFALQKPLSWLLFGFGLPECVLVVYFLFAARPGDPAAVPRGACASVTGLPFPFP